jgi:hypothetical protein
MYLLEGESGMDTFFDTFDLGIKSITFDDFSSLKNIPIIGMVLELLVKY